MEHRVVLVHGFIGWGEEELAVRVNGNDVKFRYFGGIEHDIRKHLDNKPDLRVKTASVGPINSNWDRACELYAQLMGTRVDYGASHAAKFGHCRYGHDYKGEALFKGETWDKNNPISIIGHSMGGTTGRQLIHLLEHGCPEERAWHESNPDDNPISDLFATGDKSDWIFSLSTISTPHNGTTLVDALGANDDDTKVFIALLAGTLDLLLPTDILTFSGYDLDLDHWGLDSLKRCANPKKRLEKLCCEYKNFKKPGRSLPDDQWEAFFTTEDILTYDAKPSVQKEKNKTITESKQVYYLAYSNADTRPDPRNDNKHVGSERHFSIFNADKYQGDLKSTSLAFLFSFLASKAGINKNKLGRNGKMTLNFTRLMGGYTDRTNTPKINKSWWENDGIVNLKSMKGPIIGRQKRLVPDLPPDPNQIEKGQFYHVKHFAGFDHARIVGIRDIPIKCPLEWFLAMTSRIKSLISTKQKPSAPDDIYQVYDDITEPVLRLWEKRVSQ